MKFLKSKKPDKKKTIASGEWSSEVRVTGLAELQQMFEEIAPRHARNLMRSTIHGIASEVAKDAKKRAPKDTKNLSKAIKAKRRRMENNNPRSDVIVTQGRDAKNDAFYWRWS